MPQITAPVTTQTARVSANGDHNESQTYAFDFANEPAVVAGATLSSAVVEYCGDVLLDPAAPLALTVGTVAVVGTQAQVSVTVTAAAAGHVYFFTATGTLSDGSQPIVAGRLQVAVAG